MRTAAAFLVALAVALPAAAQPESLTLRPYGMITEQAFSAQTTFNAIFGQSAEPFWGAGAELILPNHVYVDVSASRFKKTGQRAFIDNGQTFRLGIPLAATLTAVVLLVRLLNWSRTWTVTAGLMAAPAVVLVGC